MNQARIIEQNAVAQQRKNLAYRLVSSDDDEPRPLSAVQQQMGSKVNKRSKQEHIRLAFVSFIVDLECTHEIEKLNNLY